MDLKTMLIIGALIFAVFWIKDNKPDIYATGQSTLGSMWSKLTSKNVSTTPTPIAPASQVEEQPEAEGDLINYGKPTMPFSCNDDIQCIRSYPLAFDIKCNLQTGECMGEVK